MACYLNEAAAKAKLTELAQLHNDDFLIYVRKRVTKTPNQKTVTYAVVFLYDESNEAFYNEVLKYFVENDEETRILSSETFLENQKKKEVFFIECLVEARW